LSISLLSLLASVLSLGLRAAACASGRWSGTAHKNNARRIHGSAMWAGGSWPGGPYQEVSETCIGPSPGWFGLARFIGGSLSVFGGSGQAVDWAIPGAPCSAIRDGARGATCQSPRVAHHWV
jgi:hypothetical protein